MRDSSFENKTAFLVLTLAEAAGCARQGQPWHSLLKKYKKNTNTNTIINTNTNTYTHTNTNTNTNDTNYTQNIGHKFSQLKQYRNLPV